MNWTVIFAVLTVLGPILIATSAKNQAGDKDQPMGVQAGYLALVLGGFGLLAQWLSFSAVMLVFVLVTGVITAANRWLLAQSARSVETAAQRLLGPEVRVSVTSSAYDLQRQQAQIDDFIRKMVGLIILTAVDPIDIDAHLLTHKRTTP